ncbi:SnoaL-like domain-containing protein [Brevibacterium sandarakinum]|uniref:SnoaL-like domain-containing protein n=1 Tax=Brevibacterium sandarakinum TaxID=629680 RepID=A0A1H1XF12_BRESA|nr:nuclear transport factor 2 family protein [Brevibacterium sandarakinum]SDT07742.1 SnoaL-like domain-containing protein [Brevibacterium sandarakinum]
MSGPGTDAEQCRTLLIDFLTAIDQGRATDALELFTPDAVFDARGTTLRGHDGIADFLAAREGETERHTVHVIVNDAVRRHEDREIELTALLMLYERQSDGTYRLDRILDTAQTFQRLSSGWRISARTTRPVHPAA